MGELGPPHQSRFLLPKQPGESIEGDVSQSSRSNRVAFADQSLGLTGGGITSALSEIAQNARVGIHLDEARIPISEEVKGACEILGLDPLYVANEGKLLAIVSAEEAGPALAAMQAHSLGGKAAVIGSVTDEHPGFVTMKTRIGGTRVVEMLSGEQLPRIC
jgi:hydrogenase expression/formation protein HypE